MTDFYDVHNFGLVNSTNDVVKQAALDGAKEGFTAIADRQSAGRGRLGRDFFSPGGSGLYMSVLLRPKIAPDKAPIITTMAAVAVCEAIERQTSQKPGIKWINDIILNGRKICGILTQSAQSSPEKIDYAILGIGLNITPPEGGYPEEIRNKAGALYPSKAPDGAKDALCRLILDNFKRYYDRLPEKSHAEGYKKRLMTIGREVEVIRPGCDALSGTAIGVDDDLGLIVKYDSGVVATVSSGEVSARHEYV